MPITTEKKVRLFYALWPEEEIRAALANLQSDIVGDHTFRQNFHITLAFLGSQAVSSLPILRSVLANLPDAGMQLEINRRAYFRRNRIAWAGMHTVPDALRGLQSELSRQLMQETIVFDNKAAFQPHITLARNAEAPPERKIQSINWQARQVALVQSSTTQEGVRYALLATRGLKLE